MPHPQEQLTFRFVDPRARFLIDTWIFRVHVLHDQIVKGCVGLRGWGPCHARLLMDREPALAGFFQTRERRAA
jgi:hypothetical protein